jgi:hypothetical protein
VSRLRGNCCKRCRQPSNADGEGWREVAAQTQVAKILTEKYAAKFDPGFSTAVAGNIAKAYETVAPKAGNSIADGPC